jgi:signal peptidase II
MIKRVHKVIQTMNSFIMGPVFFGIVCLVVDQYSKLWVRETLPYQEAVPIFSHLNFYLTYNTGMAFGLFSKVDGDQRYILLFLASVVILYLVRFLKTQGNRAPTCLVYALYALLAGTVGNAIDRLCYGRVTDFIDVTYGHWHFAVFNVADVLISLSFMLILLTRWE